MEKIQYKIQCLLLLVVLSMCSTSAVFAGWLTDPSQLTIGCVIKIYPLGGSSEQALSCAGKGQPLTTYNKAKTGDTWFITNAGDNHVYIVNGETYVSWGFHGEKSMTCDYSRVPVRISWDSDKERVTFSNAVDGQKLLFSRNYSYFKWGGNAGDDEQYFGIEIVKQDGNYGPAIYDTKKSDYHLPVSLLLYLNSKTARQINDLLTVRGIIPSVVTDDGVDYTVTSMDGFYNCKYLREAEIPNTIKSLPERCF